MVVSELHLYELLRAKLGVAEAEAFVAILESKVDKKFEEKLDVLATKSDVQELRAEMLAMKGDLLRSIYLVSIGQYLAVIGSILAILMFIKNFV
jgi:hypothetical protein